MSLEEFSREFETSVSAAALSLVGADGRPDLAKGRTSHWRPRLL